MAVDLRPKVTTSPLGVTTDEGTLTGVNLQDVTEVDRSAVYEGFYFGLGFAF